MEFNVSELQSRRDILMVSGANFNDLIFNKCHIRSNFI